jgi:hypothetical protein
MLQLSSLFFDFYVMENDKINCWEFKKCGREPEGFNTSELGVCEVSTYEVLDGIHGGMNAGRCCWVIYGACYTHTERPKSFSEHTERCSKCDFYALVHKTEEVLVVL